MNARVRSGWIAVGLLVVTTLCMLLAALMPDDDWPLVAIFALGTVLILTAAVGTVIAVRANGHRVGWILIGIGLSISTGMVATQYANRALVDAPGSLPFAQLAAWLQAWLWTPLVALFAWLVLVFPTGRPPSPRWRIVGWLAFALMVAAATTVAFRPGSFDALPAVVNPLGIGAFAVLNRLLDAVGLPLAFVTYAGAVASIIVRFRRSRGIERQQLKWFAYAVIGAVALASLNLLAFVVGLDRLGEWTTFVFGALAPLLAFLLLPLGIGIAILRTRLYDIDRIISRTLSYATVTAFLAGTFALVVLVPTALIGRGGHAPDWVIAVATLVVAASFRPVRRRVQDAIDHRFNRARYDAEHTIETFTARLREQIDIDALGAELVGIVDRTMHPVSASIWMRPRT